MNRWWGSQKDSESQSAERSQRAARRTLRDLNLNPLSDEDEELVFEDCDTSFRESNIFNLDGNDEIEDLEEIIPGTMNAAQIAAQKLLPFQDSSFPDDDDAWKKELRIKFEIHDVKYWFNSVESEMKKFGINTQWSKKNAIVPMLPEEVVEECKPILRLSEDEAGDHIYRDLKQEITKLYGPRPQDAFRKAMALRLTGKPSALGKKLLHIICPGAKPLEGCHCDKMVYGFWEAQLGKDIRAGIADYEFNKDTYKKVFDLADKLYLANGGGQISSHAVVAAASVADLSDPNPQVSALQSGGGRGGRGQRGGRGGRGGRGAGRGGAQGGNTNSSQNQFQNQNSQPNSNKGSAPRNNSNYQPKPHQRGQRASPDVPDNACSRHWSQGRNATYCSDPLNCSWVHIIAPRT